MVRVRWTWSGGHCVTSEKLLPTHPHLSLYSIPHYQFPIATVKTPPQGTREDTSAELNCENLALIELENKYHPMALWDGNHVKYISLSSSITRECCFVSLSRVEVKHYLISRMVLGNKYEILSVFIFYCRCNPLDRLSSIINVPCIREPH